MLGRSRHFFCDLRQRGGGGGGRGGGREELTAAVAAYKACFVKKQTFLFQFAARRSLKDILTSWSPNTICLMCI